MKPIMSAKVRVLKITKNYWQSAAQLLWVGIALMILIPVAKNLENTSKRMFLINSLKYSLTFTNPEGPYDRMIERAGRDFGVDPNLIRAVIQTESQFNERCRSHAGAKGLMQLMPQTARWMGVQNIWDPEDNVRGGTKYLKLLLDRYHGDLQLTLGAYNAGHVLVDRLGRIPRYPETQSFVRQVTRLYKKASPS